MLFRNCGVLFVNVGTLAVLFLATTAAPSNAFVILGGSGSRLCHHRRTKPSFSNGKCVAGDKAGARQSNKRDIQLLHETATTFTTTTTLWGEQEEKQVPSDGTSLRGPLLFALSLFICVWFFTIPPEFRRARLCDEEQTAAYPDKCMTLLQMSQGIAAYYQQGGGIQWDFSVDPGIKEYFNNYGGTLPSE